MRRAFRGSARRSWSTRRASGSGSTGRSRRGCPCSDRAPSGASASTSPASSASTSPPFVASLHNARREYSPFAGLLSIKSLSSVVERGLFAAPELPGGRKATTPASRLWQSSPASTRSRTSAGRATSGYATRSARLLTAPATHPWAQAVYARAIAKGHDHQRAIRTLGRAWSRVVALLAGRRTLRTRSRRPAVHHSHRPQPGRRQHRRSRYPAGDALAPSLDVGSAQGRLRAAQPSPPKQRSGGGQSRAARQGPAQRAA